MHMRTLERQPLDQVTIGVWLAGISERNRQSRSWTRLQSDVKGLDMNTRRSYGCPLLLSNIKYLMEDVTKASLSLFACHRGRCMVNGEALAKHSEVTVETDKLLVLPSVRDTHSNLMFYAAT
eukprot:scaffold124886_cov29-Prasinocladus_malaysianus.AAC.1